MLQYTKHGRMVPLHSVQKLTGYLSLSGQERRGDLKINCHSLVLFSQSPLVTKSLPISDLWNVKIFSLLDEWMRQSVLTVPYLNIVLLCFNSFTGSVSSQIVFNRRKRQYRAWSTRLIVHSIFIVIPSPLLLPSLWELSGKLYVTFI